MNAIDRRAKMLGENPSDSDPLIGMMDSRELAEAAVRGHNLAWQQGE
jgi:hypothetical protein